MSEKPQLEGKRATATSCTSVKICWPLGRFSKQFLMGSALEVTESKRELPGSNTVAGFSCGTAMKMQDNRASCTVGEGLCIQ